MIETLVIPVVGMVCRTFGRALRCRSLPNPVHLADRDLSGSFDFSGRGFMDSFHFTAWCLPGSFDLSRRCLPNPVPLAGRNLSGSFDLSGVSWSTELSSLAVAHLRYTFRVVSFGPGPFKCLMRVVGSAHRTMLARFRPSAFEFSIKEFLRIPSLVRMLRDETLRLSPHAL